MILTFWCFIVFPSTLMAQNRHAFQFQTATWNMQGASSSATGQRTWDVLKNKLINERFEVVALQECGGVPSSADPVKRLVQYGVGIPSLQVIVPRQNEQAAGDVGPLLDPYPNLDINGVGEYVWYPGSKSRTQPYYLYHYAIRDTDPNLRVNLAILSTQRAEKVILVGNAGFHRSVFGIKIGCSYFFNIHAPARENNQSPQMISNIEEYMETQISQCELQHLTWLLMGDFNRDLTATLNNLPPLTFGTLVSNRYWSTGEIIQLHRRTVQAMQGIYKISTQRSGGVLDYAIIECFNVHLCENIQMTASLIDGLQYGNGASDHSAIRFTPQFF